MYVSPYAVIIDIENKTKKEKQVRRELAEEGENMKLI